MPPIHGERNVVLPFLWRFMPKVRALMVVAGIAASFVGLAGTIVFLSMTNLVSVEMAMLMLVALVGLYIGFGVLVAVYRLISKLE